MTLTVPPDTLKSYAGDSCQLVENEVIKDDLWMLDIVLSTWTLVAKPVGQVWSLPLVYHSAVVVEDTLVVYGGRSWYCGDFCDLFWEFYLSNPAIGWTQQTPVGRNARWKHCAGRRQGNVIIFGGYNRQGPLNDIIEYRMDIDPRGWMSIPSSGAKPTPRFGAVMHIDHVNDWLYVYGGLSNLINPDTGKEYSFLGDMWRFSFSSLRWMRIRPIELDPVPSLVHHAWSSLRDIMIVYGGFYSFAYQNSTYKYNFTSNVWTKQKIPFLLNPLEARASHAMVSMESDLKVVLIGGQGVASAETRLRDSEIFSTVWHLDVSQCTSNCYGRGSCFFGTCVCWEGFLGDECQTEACPGTQCVFDSEISLSQTCTVCSGQGTCERGTCMCESDFKGDQCEQLFCPFNCHSRGTCSRDSETSLLKCTCGTAYYGPYCEYIRCPKDCSNRGTCDGKGNCLCNQVDGGAYIGDDCSICKFHLQLVVLHK